MIEMLEVDNMSGVLATCWLAKNLKVWNADSINELIDNELLIKHQLVIRKLIKATGLNNYKLVLDYKNWCRTDLIT